MPSANDLSLFSIGHSTHPLDRFIELLQLHQIDAVADVRSSPYSRFNPQYNRETLKRALRAAGIRYVFLGHELGARRTESECFVGTKVSYPLVARCDMFRRGIDRLVDGASRMRISIMCAEKDPLECHRTILVAHHARYLFSHIQHIREDGNIETQEAADRRLLAMYHLTNSELFRPWRELLDEAYLRRGDEIAFEENRQSTAS